MKRLHSLPNTVIYNGFNNSGQKNITPAFSTSLNRYLNFAPTSESISVPLPLSLVPGEGLLALGLNTVLPFPCSCSVLAVFNMLAQIYLFFTGAPLLFLTSPLTCPSEVSASSLSFRLTTPMSVLTLSSLFPEQVVTPSCHFSLSNSIFPLLLP